MTAFDVDGLRARFPALALTSAGEPMAFFDGPGGTQVPDTVIEAVVRYYRESNANNGGDFETSRRSDAIVAEAHAALADLLGADADEVKLGANMTTLTLHASRSITATMTPGDEIVVTRLDHEANIGPWRLAAADRGLAIREVDVRVEDGTLDLDSLDTVLGPRTRLVAFGWASNALGTVNPVAELVRRSHGAGALTYVDAVHAAPHLPLDVRAVDADFVACSAYKFFGPHIGVLYGRRDVLDRLPSYKIKPAHDRYETGTGNFEGQAGTLAAVEYIADIGRRYRDAGDDRRAAVLAGMTAIRGHEMDLYRRLVDGLDALPGTRVWGVTDRSRFNERTPTAAVTFDGVTPHEVSRTLGERGIATWHGDFYATSLIERLGLAEAGGVLRIGLTHYNTVAEVDRLLDALEQILRRSGAVAARA
jgi:cysteine desulfurase family protein (TIGR01976 family)